MGEDCKKLKIDLPSDVSFIIRTIEDAGYEAYAVGGCVRDYLMGKTPDDWDITTSAEPAKIKELFKRTIDTGLQHGTVTVRLHQTSYEVTTFRIDGKYSDGRHPDHVNFVTSLEEDLKRRDFTINAMAYSDRTGIIDLFDGKKDLKDKIIRSVGEPEKRFSEDALRMMRAVRFAARFGFEIEENTKAAIKDLSPTLSKVAAERIRVEFEKTICSDHPEFVRMLFELGLTKVFLPEWDICMNCPQNTVHHLYTVGEHTIRVMENVPNDRILRLSAFFHDIGKPVSRKQDKKGQDHFVGHPIVGAEMTENIMKRLRYDNATIEKVVKLVRFHDDRPAVTKRNIRREISRVGKEDYPLLLILRRADVSGQSDFQRDEKLKRIDDSEALFKEIESDNEALSIRDLELRGGEIIALGVPKGPMISTILNTLVSEVVDCPEKNNHEFLVAEAKKIYESERKGFPYIHED